MKASAPPDAFIVSSLPISVGPGKTSDEIALLLGITERTARRHIPPARRSAAPRGEFKRFSKHFWIGGGKSQGPEKPGNCGWNAWQLFPQMRALH